MTDVPPAAASPCDAGSSRLPQVGYFPPTSWDGKPDRQPDSPSVLTAVAEEVSPPLARIDTDMFGRMIAAGVLPDMWPVELIDGLLVCRDRRDEGGPIWNYEVRQCYFHEELRHAVEGAIGAVVGERPERRREGRGPVYWGNSSVVMPPYSQTYPDGLLTRGGIDDYRERFPGPADVLLIAEVAGASLDHDRVTKGRVYASAGLQPYWILDTRARTLEVRTDPNPAAGEYRSLATLTAADTAVVPLPTGDASLPLADLFG